MTDAAGKGLFPGAAIAQNLSAWCQFCFDLTDRDDECLLRHGWCAAIRRTRKARHERTSGNHRPLPPFSGHRQAASRGRPEASQQDGDQGGGAAPWSVVEGKLVLDSPDEMGLVFDVAVFDTRAASRAPLIATRAHPAAPGRTKPSRWMLCNTAGSTSSACSGDGSPAWPRTRLPTNSSG